jgi:hypothetical protein
MARSTAEIQADIAVTRRVIEHQLEALEHRVPREWWVPYAAFAGALVLGIVMSRVSLLRLLGTGARSVQAGLTVATTVAAVDRFLAERHRLRAA